MILELVSRTGPGSGTSPSGGDCLGGIITNQTVTNTLCHSFSSILPLVFTLFFAIILLRMLTYFMGDDSRSRTRHQPEETAGHDENDGFLHRFFYRKKKRKEEEGDSQE